MNALNPLPFPDVEGLSEAINRAFELEVRYAELDAPEILTRVLRHEFAGRIALVSSFGAESAVLLHMVAAVDPATPVIFLDTGKLFGETLRYRDELVRRLGLSDVRSVRPTAERLALEDGDGFLFRRDPDRCCYLRKVLPLERALDGFDAWITGRKAYQGGMRSGLVHFEAEGHRVKVNPLARWSRQRLDAYFPRHDLPRHPLEAEGFLSIGCMPCTDRVAPGEHLRAGRWRGIDKNECGIHHLGSV